MASHPMIATEKFIFRPAELSDAEWIQRLLIDSRVAWALPRRYPPNREAVRTWLQDLQERQGRTEFHFVVTPDGITPWGVVSLFEVDWQNRNAGLAIALTPTGDRPRGIGSEVIHRLAVYGFSELGLHRVWATIYSSNERSLRAFERAGFELEGRDREARYVHGHWVDVIRMAQVISRMGV